VGEEYQASIFLLRRRCGCSYQVFYDFVEFLLLLGVLGCGLVLVASNDGGVIGFVVVGLVDSG
jgi:hypothetical protein